MYCPKCGGDADINKYSGEIENLFNGELTIRFDAECLECEHSFKILNKFIDVGYSIE